MVTLTCEVCGTSFDVRPYRANRARFCSRRCGGSWHAATRLARIPKPWNIGNKHRAGMAPTNAFQPGHDPWNKGVSGLRLSPKTEFQMGMRPCSALPVGAETTRADKNGNPRVWRKVAEPNKWRPRAQLVWEDHSGVPLPRGGVVHHVNRDSTDDRIENLECLTRAEHMDRHRDDLRGGGYERAVETEPVAAPKQVSLFGEVAC